MSCLSRTVIGTILKPSGNHALVVTLPGKPKAIQENLQILFSDGIMKHAVA